MAIPKKTPAQKHQDMVANMNAEAARHNTELKIQQSSVKNPAKAKRDADAYAEAMLQKSVSIAIDKMKQPGEAGAAAGRFYRSSVGESKNVKPGSDSIRVNGKNTEFENLVGARNFYREKQGKAPMPSYEEHEVGRMSGTPAPKNNPLMQPSKSVQKMIEKKGGKKYRA